MPQYVHNRRQLYLTAGHILVPVVCKASVKLDDNQINQQLKFVT